jgi:hypothetical protein
LIASSDPPSKCTAPVPLTEVPKKPDVVTNIVAALLDAVPTNEPRPALVMMPPVTVIPGASVPWKQSAD